MLPWLSLPERERARLIRNEKAQRRETVKRGLPALPVSVEGLWLIQRGHCTCGECRGEVPLEPGKIVIAHIYFRGGVGSPGHVPHNVALWRSECNAREAGPETSAMWKGRRMAPVKADTVDDPQPEQPRRKSGFQKPAGHVSPLSKKSPGYRKQEWRKK